LPISIDAADRVLLQTRHPDRSRAQRLAFTGGPPTTAASPAEDTFAA
jgi:hypothetical protein